MSTLTERERAERAAYAETRDGAIPRLDRMAWGDEDAQPITATEARFIFGVMAICLIVLALLIWAGWMATHGERIWQ